MRTRYSTGQILQKQRGRITPQKGFPPESQDMVAGRDWRGGPGSTGPGSKAEAGWVNHRGSWVNGGGGGWANRGASWVNGGGGWINRGGSWANGHGGVVVVGSIAAAGSWLPVHVLQASQHQDICAMVQAMRMVVYNIPVHLVPAYRGRESSCALRTRQRSCKLSLMVISRSSSACSCCL